MPCRYAFGDDGAPGVFTQMNHLGSGVCLLIITGQCHRIKLAHRIITLEHTAWVFPCNSTAGLNLSPGYLGPISTTFATLGNKVIDATNAILITRIPVLHRRVFNLCILKCHQLNDRRMQLILITHRCRTPFKVTYM